MSPAVTLKPILSEKAYGLSQAGNTYVFSVGKDVNRLQVSAAVSEQYKVEVTSVRMASVPGRSQAIISRRRRLNREGRRQDVRKAYVTLKEGDKLPFFAAVEEASKQEVAAEAKAAKKSSKEKK